MKNLNIIFSKKIIPLIIFLSPLFLFSQTTLSINPDSLFFQQVPMGIIPPDAGMGISELTFGTEFNRSFLRPHELRINDGGIKPFFCNTRLNNFELNFNFDRTGVHEIDWTLAKEFDPLYFAYTFTFARAAGGGAFSIKPLTIQADTVNQESYLYLENRIGINADTVKKNRIAVFAKTDDYSDNRLGAIQAYKRVTSNTGAAVTGTANDFGDDSPVAENILTSTGNLAGYTLGRNVAVHGHDYNGGGAGVIGSTLGTHQNPAIWGALGFDEFAIWSNGEQFSTTNAVWSTSDARLKKQIKSQSNMLDRVMSLSPKEYIYSDDEQFRKMSFPSEMQHGFLAQEVEKIFPELVRDVELSTLVQGNENLTYKAINYNGFIAILTTALQESQNENDEQQALISSLIDSNQKLQDQLQVTNAAISLLNEKITALEQRSTDQ